MFTTKREKVKSTPFSDFVRHASANEKIKFFDKVVQDTIQEQKTMIDKADEVSGACKNQSLL